MAIDRAQLESLLLEQNLVDEDDLTIATQAAEEGNVPLVTVLLNKNMISRDALGNAIASWYDVPYVDLQSRTPSQDGLFNIPESTAKSMRVVLFDEDEEAVTLATDEPTQSGIEETLKTFFPDKTVSVAYALPIDIDLRLNHYRIGLNDRLVKMLEKESLHPAPELLQQIFSDAIDFRTSDVHFEPQQHEVRVRFRIDGVLQDVARVPRPQYEQILNRVKVKSNLRIDRHFTAQDGSMRIEHEDRMYDLRTSIVPTVDGEKIVVRVLASYVKGLSFDALGLSEGQQEILDRVSHKPFGMILVTGPTGSGKTTTLYSLIKQLSTPEVNVTTIEDPVEYKMKGVNQIQVNEETKLTFAEGLRSIVRQDPDVILVGEIRDRETVEISVNAALTGHLLLSTFHSNDASTAIPRLLDMGAEPFLLASTLEVVIAQRLVRRICDSCRYSKTVAKSELPEAYQAALRGTRKKKITVYGSKTCKECGFTGYKGRTAIYEFIPITAEMEQLILKDPSSQEIWELASTQGVKSMFEEGMKKVEEGITTFEELYRVVEPPQTSNA